MCCSSAKPVDEGISKSVVRKAVTFVLFTVTGGVALSALDDLTIYHSCSRYVICECFPCLIHSGFRS